MISDMDCMDWLRERRANCKRIAESKLPGEDRFGWESDALYFLRAMDMITYYHDAYSRVLEELHDALKKLANR